MNAAVFLSALITGMVLGSTGAGVTLYTYVLPIVYEVHEQSILDQMWPCGHEKGDVAWITLAAKEIPVGCDRIRESKELADLF